MHVAIERVSMWGAKEVEDVRIGGSPIEKSTRYLDFYDKDPTTMFYCHEKLFPPAELRAYKSACVGLFETYRELTIKLTALFDEKTPHTDKGDVFRKKTIPL